MGEKSHFIEIRIPSELGYEKMAMKLAGAVAQKMEFASDRIEDLKTAVAEACLNAMEHGNQLDASTQVLVLLNIDDDRLAIDVKDEGRGGAPPERFPEPGVNRKTLRHMGIYIIRNLVDEAAFVEPDLGKGNQFRMVIHLQRQ